LLFPEYTRKGTLISDHGSALYDNENVHFDHNSALACMGLFWDHYSALGKKKI